MVSDHLKTNTLATKKEQLMTSDKTKIPANGKLEGKQTLNSSLGVSLHHDKLQPATPPLPNSHELGAHHRRAQCCAADM